MATTDRPDDKPTQHPADKPRPADKPADKPDKGKGPKPSGPGTTTRPPGPGLGSAASSADVDLSEPRPLTENMTVVDPFLDRRLDMADWDPRLPPHGTPIARPDPGRPYPEDGERGVAWTLPPSLGEGAVEPFPVGATMADPTGAKSASGKSDADIASREAHVGGRKPHDQTR